METLRTLIVIVNLLSARVVLTTDPSEHGSQQTASGGKEHEQLQQEVEGEHLDDGTQTHVKKQLQDKIQQTTEQHRTPQQEDGVNQPKVKVEPELKKKIDEEHDKHETNKEHEDERDVDNSHDKGDTVDTEDKKVQSKQDTYPIEATPLSKDDENKNYLDIEKLFSFNDKDLWGKEYLQERIRIRLVKKSWQAWGPANKTDEILEEFSWDQASSDHLIKCLHETPPYQYIERPFTEGHILLQDEEFRKYLPNIFIFPTSSAHRDISFIQTTVTALGMRNLHRSHNVFTFDMTRLDFNMFFSVLHTYFGENPNFYLMGKAVADFFINAIKKGVIKQDNIHLIGWGYSAQLVGYIARIIHQKTMSKVGTIVALNPIGVVHNSFMTSVNKEDAELVYVYHSNSYPIGTTARMATTDFVFNGGFAQPECEENESRLLCSHDGVVKRFWYVVLYGGNLYEARKCDSLVRFNFGLCNRNPTAKLTYPVTNKPIEGKHFLRTTGTAPYGETDRGSFSDPKMREAMKKAILDHKKTGASKDDLMMFVMWLLD